MNLRGGRLSGAGHQNGLQSDRSQEKKMLGLRVTVLLTRDQTAPRAISQLRAMGSRPNDSCSEAMQSILMTPTHDAAPIKPSG